MTDLRDQPAKDAAQKEADEVFLTYHENSPWAQAKVKDGLRLNPEGLEYMRRENEGRAEARVRFEKENEAFEAKRRRDAGVHDSDCATNNMPATSNGPCDCALSKPAPKP